MPGVESTISARGAGTKPVNREAQAFLVMLAERGPVTGDALPVSSPRQFVNTFGNATAYSSGYWQVALALLAAPIVWVARVAGDDADVGTRALKDGGASAGTDTIRLDAVDPGAWSADVTVQVQNGGIANADTALRTITLRFRVGQAGERVEIYRNLATVTAIVQAINARSQLVTATNLNSVAGSPLPRVLAASALSAGDDDRATVDAAAVLAALDRFPASLGPGLVAIPGWAIDDVGAGLIAHGKANGRIAYLAGDENETAANIKSLADQLVDEDGRHAGVGFGWLTISDGTRDGTINISAEGFIAAVRARTINTIGVWQAPAGIYGIATGDIKGLVTDVPKDTGDDLNENHVNAIRVIKASIRNYGWRSLSSDDTFAGLHVQDLANSIRWDLEQEFEDDVFTGIDDKGVFENRLTSKAEGVLGRKYRDGLDNLVIDGRESDKGYVIDVEPEPENKRMVVTVGFRPIGMAETIFIAISVAATGVAF